MMYKRDRQLRRLGSNVWLALAPIGLSRCCMMNMNLMVMPVNNRMQNYRDPIPRTYIWMPITKTF